MVVSLVKVERIDLMKWYLDITLLPSADISLYFLWEKLYQQLHLSLVESQAGDGSVKIGVIFPEYNSDKHGLGSKLRLVSPSNEELESLNINKRLFRLSDYVHITAIREVPDKVEGYVFFRRIQPKNNNARLARRMVKRKNISYEQALSHFESREEKKSKLPFINMKSQSSDNRFRLFIEKVDSESQVAGTFNSYGLSKTATVPWF